MTRLSSDGAAVISTQTKWLPISADTPRGVKLQLISKKYGVAHLGVLLASNKYYTHWHPLPSFDKAE